MPHLQEGRQDVSVQQRVKTRDDDEWLVGIVRLRCNPRPRVVTRYYLRTGTGAEMTIGEPVTIAYRFTSTPVPARTPDARSSP